MSDYKDDFKESLESKLVLKSNVINTSSTTPSDSKIMTESLVINVLNNRIGELNDLIGGV